MFKHLRSLSLSFVIRFTLFLFHGLYWVCGCVFVCGFLLFTEGTSVSEIYFIHQKPIFPAYSLPLVFLSFRRVLREVNPTDETDPHFLLSPALFKSLPLLRKQTILFNWLTLLHFDWCVKNYSKKGSLKNLLKNFDTCATAVCILDCRPKVVNKTAQKKNHPKTVLWTHTDSLTLTWRHKSTLLARLVRWEQAIHIPLSLFRFSFVLIASFFVCVWLWNCGSFCAFDWFSRFLACARTFILSRSLALSL